MPDPDPKPEAVPDLDDGTPVDDQAEEQDAEPDHQQVPGWDPDDTGDDQ